MNNLKNRAISAFLALLMLLSMVPVGAVETRAEETTLTNFEGLKLSILGDSISTYQNYSNGTAAETTNSTITNNAKYYPYGGIAVTVGDTWWHQAARALGMEVLVNNSWSGSCMYSTSAGTVGAYVDRCVQLHDDTGDNAGEEPDIIAIYLGTNDQNHAPGSLGTFDAIDFDTLITVSDGVYSYKTPTTTLEAYAISLHKIGQRYPNAEVYCLTLLPRSGSHVATIQSYNANVEKLAAHYGAYAVDLYDCGVQINSAAFSKLMPNALHPNAYGMDAITNAFLSSILKNSKYMPADAAVYDISWTLDGVVAMQGTSKAVLGGEAYEVTLEAVSTGYELDVSVTMGGADITESCYADGVISIPAVTGDIAITATAKELPPVPEAIPEIDRELTNFRWELQDDALVNVTDGGNTANALTKTHGSISGGTFSGARFTMAETVYLNHDQPWSLEWQSTGNWSSSGGGALLVAQNTTSPVKNSRYLYRRNNTEYIALGYYDGSVYHNYCAEFSGTGIDATVKHVYRLTNRIAEDGTNMVYLYVDGTEVGPLNRHYRNGSDRQEVSNWVSGKNFQFTFLGTQQHVISNCSIDYIQVWETGTDTAPGGPVEPDEPETPTEPEVPEDWEPENYRWELQNNALVSVTDGENAANTLTLTHGSVVGGVQTAARYALTEPIDLYHDRPWSVEWKSEGTWSNSMQGGLLFAENNSSRAEGYYFYRRSDNAPKGLFALGEYKSGTWYNYGITLSQHNIDDSALHTYRMTNRIADDGGNMVYLYVDDVEVGPLNGYNVNGTNKGTTNDWVSGKDFTFNYLGTDVHTLNNCTIHYIQVWEGGKPDYAGKVISIMGDSISTFAGYIPVADGFNREHLARYPQDNLVTDVNETWWMQTVKQLGAKLGINDSWRGATVSGATPVTSGDTGENAATSNLTRIRNLGSNGTPDVILFYGGTNDLAHVSKVGTFDPETAPTEVDLTTKKWDNLADGYVHTLLRMKHFYPNALILAMLPTYTQTYYSDSKLAQGNEVMARICEHYEVPYVDLRDSGVTAELLPDGIHPGAEGMDLITAAVIDALNQCEMEKGTHTVYSVSHQLTEATASLGHFKGIDAGAAFEETLSGNNLTVKVTMGGVDITESCYQDGKISILAVTGDLVITAKASFSLGGRLQQRPEHCCDVNLWAVLEHDTQYYSVDGWTVHASGKVRSVTFPVIPGEKITASSFGAKGTNGGTINGIRVTYFSESGLLKSMTADAVYGEFSKNGYLTVPEGANAISIPMWTAAETWEIYILNPEGKFCVDGANMTLGTDLAMNFYIEPSDLEAEDGHYAVITKAYADGRDIATKRVEQADWSWHEGYQQHYVTFDDVAAKEMTDVLTVVIYNSEGEAVSHVWTDSVRNYAMRMLKKEEAKDSPDAEKLALYVDMLNYGTAAQKYFKGYHGDDLANGGLTDDQKAYATASVEVSDGRIKGKGYSASNLTLESEIVMNFFFLGSHVDQSMYAVAAFTDHYGNDRCIRIEGSQFRQLKNDTDWYVPVTGLVVADFRQPVTVTVYHADGTVAAEGTDSIESYVARMKSVNPLFEAITNFCAAAYATFH